MTTYPKQPRIPYAPTEENDLYPDTDGEPMAASDLHRQQLTRTLQTFETHYDPVRNEWLQTQAEAAETRAEIAETRAAQAEAEASELREQLARLQARP